MTEWLAKCWLIKWLTGNWLPDRLTECFRLMNNAISQSCKEVKKWWVVNFFQLWPNQNLWYGKRHALFTDVVDLHCIEKHNKAATKFKVFYIRYFSKTKRKPAKKKNHNSVYRLNGWLATDCLTGWLSVLGWWTMQFHKAARKWKNDGSWIFFSFGRIKICDMVRGMHCSQM